MQFCERCLSGNNVTTTAVKGERYCKGCKRVVLYELRKNGYLVPPPAIPRPRERVAEAIREAARACKFGHCSGSWDNVVKAYEEDR